ncbi:MAG: FliH/SctL family protein [Mariprofundus sp.]|nr:FliH/SctL family protein [Mariprofundus sp.]
MAAFNPLTYPAGSAEEQVPPSHFPFVPGAHTQNMETASTENRAQQLEKMLQEVQGRAEIVEKEAYDNAYLAGEKAGMTLGKRRGEQILDELQTSLNSMEVELTEIRDGFAEAAIDVAEHIAKQIVGETLADKAKMIELANKAAAQLPTVSKLHIAVSSDDYTAFKRLLDDDPDSTSVLSADANVESGSCRIISADQDILIDPMAAISNYLMQLRTPLLAPPTDKPSIIDE